MKQVLSVFFLSLVFATGVSQPCKFGKITSEQWTIKDCNFDSISNSIILFDVGNITIQTKEGVNNSDPECQLKDEFFYLIFERHYRIKILLNNGLTSDHVSINLRSINGKKDKLTSFQGILFTQMNGKVEQVKFNLNDLKELTNQNGGSRKILDLSDIKEGSILDIRYKIETNILNEIPYWNFRSKYPDLYSEINYTIPDFFLLSKKCDIINNLIYDFFNKSAEYGVSYPLTDGWKFYKYSYTEHHEKYSLANIPSYKELDEMYVLKYIINSINYYSVSCQKGSFRKQ
jgi:hypothetical protein